MSVSHVFVVVGEGLKGKFRVLVARRGHSQREVVVAALKDYVRANGLPDWMVDEQDTGER